MALNGTQVSQLNKLREYINKALNDCMPTATPNLCEMIQTEDGYANAEDMILTYCITNKATPYMAIPEIETELAHA